MASSILKMAKDIKGIKGYGTGAPILVNIETHTLFVQCISLVLYIQFQVKGQWSKKKHFHLLKQKRKGLSGFLFSIRWLICFRIIQAFLHTSPWEPASDSFPIYQRERNNKEYQSHNIAGFGWNLPQQTLVEILLLRPPSRPFPKPSFIAPMVPGGNSLISLYALQKAIPKEPIPQKALEQEMKAQRKDLQVYSALSK